MPPAPTQSHSCFLKQSAFLEAERGWRTPQWSRSQVFHIIPGLASAHEPGRKAPFPSICVFFTGVQTCFLFWMPFPVMSAQPPKPEGALGGPWIPPSLQSGGHTASRTLPLEPHSWPLGAKQFLSWTLSSSFTAPSMLDPIGLSKTFHRFLAAFRIRSTFVKPVSIWPLFLCTCLTLQPGQTAHAGHATPLCCAPEPPSARMPFAAPLPRSKRLPSPGPPNWPAMSVGQWGVWAEARTLPKKQEALWPGDNLIWKQSRVSFTPSLHLWTGPLSGSLSPPWQLPAMHLSSAPDCPVGGTDAITSLCPCI